MKLVLVTPFLESTGGLDRVVLKIAQHFDAKIHCLNHSPEKTFPEFKNLNIEVAKPGLLRKIPVMNRVTSAIEAGSYFYNLKLEDFDVINAHQTPSEWIRNKNSPVIWYCHTPNREAFDLYNWRMKRRNLLQKPIFWASIQAFKFFESRTVPNIEYIFTNSKNSQKRISRYLQRSSEVLHPGIETNNFSCKGYEKFFFYPSRIAPEKDFEHAIKAFKIFSSRFKDWKFIIAGSLSNRSDHQNYFKKLKSLCTPQITIETNVTEERLLDLYSRCYAVLFTPVDEDYGLVPLEAMASSKPCIAKNEGGPTETILNNKDGFLVSSIWDMAGKMEWLANNQDRCEEMGKYGRRKVQRDFTWEIFLKRFEEKARELSRS